MRVRYAGLDIGGRADYTALAVIDATSGEGWQPVDARTGRPLSRWSGYETRYTVRAIDRIRGSDHEAVSDQIAVLMGSEELQDAQLVMDATGIGDAIRSGLLRRGVAPFGITITGGQTVRAEPAPAPAQRGARGARQRPEPPPALRVPKIELATTLTVAFEAGRVSIPASLDLADVLVRELTNYRVKVLAQRVAFEAGQPWRDEHDDLVIAIALPLWLHEFRTAQRGGAFDSRLPMGTPIVPASL